VGQLLWAHDTPPRQTTMHVYIGTQLIAETNSATGTRWVHNDLLGSAVARSGAGAAVLSRTQYEPYGGIASGTHPNGVGYTGHVMDAESGLTYMQQRYQDPLLGRFLSVDPVVTDVKTGGLFNRYSYADNNPYRYKDPDGRSPFGVVAAIAVEIGYQMTVEGKSWNNLDGSNILVAGAIGAVLPGAATAIIRGGKAAKEVNTAMKAVDKLSGKPTNTANRAAKTAAAMNRNTEKAGTAIADAASDSAKAAAGVVLKNETQNAVNNDQARSGGGPEARSKAEPAPVKEVPK
jgi:RHS repeat-associated protein